MLRKVFQFQRGFSNISRKERLDDSNDLYLWKYRTGNLKIAQTEFCVPPDVPYVQEILVRSWPSVSTVQLPTWASVSTIQLPTRPSVSTIQLPTRPSVSTIQLPTWPGVSTIQLPTRPSVSTIQLPTWPSVGTIQLPTRPSVSTIVTNMAQCQYNTATNMAQCQYNTATNMTVSVQYSYLHDPVSVQYSYQHEDIYQKTVLFTATATTSNVTNIISFNIYQNDTTIKCKSPSQYKYFIPWKCCFIRQISFLTRKIGLRDYHAICVCVCARACVCRRGGILPFWLISSIKLAGRRSRNTV